MDEQKCKVCGCTWTNACITDWGPCWWVEFDLCSACVNKKVKKNGVTQYKCIKRLEVPDLEEYDGPETGKVFVVEVGSVWCQEDDQDLLIRKDYNHWLNISKETLAEHFEGLSGQ